MLGGPAHPAEDSEDMLHPSLRLAKSVAKFKLVSDITLEIGKNKDE